MENANKALFIAIGVLMGVIILSLGVFLYYSLGGYITSTQEQMENNAISSFNQHFFAFNEREDITIQEIITITNFAKESNRKNGFDGLTINNDGNNDYVTVNVLKKDPISNPITDADYLKNGSYKCKDLQENKNVDKCVELFPNLTFKCLNIVLSPHTGRCYKIEFQRIL